MIIPMTDPAGAGIYANIFMGYIDGTCYYIYIAYMDPMGYYSPIEYTHILYTHYY